MRRISLDEPGKLRGLTFIEPVDMIERFLESKAMLLGTRSDMGSNAFQLKA
jgi:hypothetical protein